MNFQREIEARLEHVDLDELYMSELEELMLDMAEFAYQEGRKSVESAEPISAQEAGFHE